MPDKSFWSSGLVESTGVRSSARGFRSDDVSETPRSAGRLLTATATDWSMRSWTECQIAASLTRGGAAGIGVPSMPAAAEHRRPAERWPDACSAMCFFFQAEDGIRDYKVTGVQTCALPI